MTPACIKQHVTLIWVGFLVIRFEVEQVGQVGQVGEGGGKITHPSKTCQNYDINVKFGTKYTHIFSFRKCTF